VSEQLDAAAPVDGARESSSTDTAALAEQSASAGSEEGAKGSGSSTGLAVGASVGVVCGILVLLLAVFLYRRRRRQARNNAAPCEDSYSSEYKSECTSPQSPSSSINRGSPVRNESFNHFVGRTSSATSSSSAFLAPPPPTSYATSAAPSEYSVPTAPYNSTIGSRQSGAPPQKVRRSFLSNFRSSDTRTITTTAKTVSSGRSGAYSPSLRRWRISDIPEFEGDDKTPPVPRLPSPALIPHVYAQTPGQPEPSEADYRSSYQGEEMAAGWDNPTRESGQSTGMWSRVFRRSNSGRPGW
jgi:hypothetical protein